MKEPSMPADRIARRVSRWAPFVVGIGVVACGRVLGQAAGDADAAVVPLLRERLQQMQAKGAAGSSSEVAARTAMPKIYEPGGDRPLWDPE
jgi:hypothetical protein